MRFAGYIVGMVATLTVLVASALSWAADSPAVALIRTNYGGAGAVSAVFDMSIYWSVREKEEKKSGELIIAPGDKFKITLGKETLVCDGKTYWQYSERNAQVVVRNFSDIDASTLPSKLFSSLLSSRKFEEKTGSDGKVELVWNGGAGIDGYKAITATVEGGVIKTLKLTDGNDNIHTYTFKKTTFDKAPKNEVFRLSAPRGVEVLDMRNGNAPN